MTPVAPAGASIQSSVGGPKRSKRHSLPLTQTRFRSGPLAPRPLRRFLATTGLSDFPSPRRWVMHSPTTNRRRQDLPGSLTDLSRRAVPFHPGESGRCGYPELPCRCGLHPFRRTGHSHRCNEADSGSLALRLLASLRRGFGCRDYSRSRSPDYMSSGRFTW